MNRTGASTVGRRRATAFIALAGSLLSLNASAVEYEVVDGQGVAEAENYSSIAVDTIAPIDTWSSQASPTSGPLSGASGGHFMVTSPDTGTTNMSGNADGSKPWLLYEFRIPEGQPPTSYVAYARAVGVNSMSNSIWLVLTDGNGNYLATPTSFEYSGTGWTWAPSATVTLTPGDYFVRVMMREDGTPLDKVVLQLADTSLVPIPTGVGPSQSPPVSTSPDADGDGIPDATENADGDPWTDPNIFNGMDVRLAAQCGTTPTCSTNDTIAEVNQCMSTTIVEEKQQFSGWNWINPPDSSCSSAYDFEPNWSSCRSTWQADWRGFVNIREDGYQCFAVAGLPDKGCASLYFHSDQLATVQTGGLPECVYRPAGVYPIQWHYTMATNSQSSMQVDYCFGGATKCMPTQPLPSSMLRPTYSGCVQASCDDLGAQCGTVADGCGGTLNCDLESGGCHGSDTCGGGGTANQCGCTGSNCCTVGVDSDGDGIDDCTEKSDGDAWTDSEIFNGMDARLADHCHAAPASALTDTIAEVNQCMTTTIRDEKDQSSGWNWQDGADNACTASYNFSLPWSHCEDNWQVDWKGFVKLDNDGTYCFDVLGTENQAAGSIFFNTETNAATYASGPKCYQVSAGVYPIQWYFEMADGSQSDFRVAYCYTRDGTSCDPVDAVPNALLRTKYKGDEVLCESGSSKCTDLCPCKNGQGTCQVDSQCRPGQVCGQSNGAFFGKPQTERVCWAATCANHDPTQGLCGAPSSPCGTTCFAVTPCLSDSDCSPGDVCGVNNGARFEEPPGIGRVCWPSACVSDPVGTGCGAIQAPCGKCECTSNCSGVACGASADDGCGGRCTGMCGDRQSGCVQNSDCAATSACVMDGGPRLGFAEGTNVCLPARCSDLDARRLTTNQDCGTESSVCGLCPECVPDCTGRSCGPDPKCGVDCGVVTGQSEPCPAGQCTPGGICIQTPQALPDIQVPTDSATPRDVPQLPSLPTQPVGSISGNFTVSDRGTAVYTIPIATPPGRAGMEPALSLRYESSKSNGLLGVGWSLEGLSVISLCPTNVARDGWAAPLDYSSNYRFCLDGKRLTVVNGGQYGADGTQYRTELETFTKVIAHAQSGISGIGYFEAHTKDGRILLYGKTENSSIFANQSGRSPNATGGGLGSKRAWAVASVSDLAGDEMDVAYTHLEPTVASCDDVSPSEPCPTEEFWPAGITYGGIGTAEPNDRSVVFSYSKDRPDQLDGFAELGLPITRTRLLAQIDAYAGPRHTRRYTLGYQAGASGLSRVASVTECADDGPGASTLPCKPSTRFSYADSAFQPSPVDAGVSDLVSLTRVGDWNGDGRDDLLVSQVRAANSLIVSDFLPGPNPSFAVYNTVDPGSIVPGGISDLNRDGRDDLLTLSAFNSSASVNSYQWWGAGSSPAYSAATLDGGDFTTTADDPFAVDINGDGLVDLLGWDTMGGHICYSPQVNTIDTELPSFHASCDLSIQPFSRWPCEVPYPGIPAEPTVLYDFNGTGRPSLFQHDCSSGKWASLQIYPPLPGQTSPTTWSWNDPGGLKSDLGISGDLGHLKFIDLNSDGAPDILELADPGQSDGALALKGFLNRRGARMELTFPVRSDEGQLVWDESNFAGAIVLDADGDGRQDLFVPSADVTSSGMWTLYHNTPADATSYYDRLKPESPIQFVKPYIYPGAGPLYMTEVGDFNGDGRDDIAIVDNNSRLQVALSNGAPADLLASIDNGAGKTITVQYDLGQGETLAYTPLRGQTCPWPARCLNRVPRLVSGHSVLETNVTSAQTQRSFSYNYQDAREGLLGQGWLGFSSRQVEEFDGGGNIVASTTINYDNSTYDNATNLYPFAGRVTGTSQTGPAAASAPLESSNAALASQTTTTSTTWSTVASDAGVPFVFAQSSLTTVSEGSPLYRVQDSISNIDQFGNVMSKERIEAPLSGAPNGVLTDTVTTSSFYSDDGLIGEWLTSLPERVSVTDVRGGQSKTRTTAFTFDDAGRLATVTKEPDDSARTLVTTLIRNDTGGVENVFSEDSAGNGRSFGIHYDSRGLLPILFTDAMGHMTQVRYDDATGQVLTKADPNGIVEQWAYDGFGRVRRHVGPGRDEQTDYENADVDFSPFLVAAETRVETTVQGGPHEVRDFDPLGRLVRTTSSGFNGASIERELLYNAQGLVQAKSRPHLIGDASQGVINFSYDPRGRITAENRPDGSSVRYSYASAATLDPSFATVGQVAGATYFRGTTDPNGNIRVTASDQFGDVVGALDELGKETIYTYGAFNLLQQVVDAKGNRTSFTSDQYGQVASQGDPDLGNSVTTYDGFGDVATHTDGSGTLRTFSYNPDGHLTSVVDPDGTTQYIYNGAGPDELDRLIQTNSPSGHTVTYAYEGATANDNRGFLRQVTYSDPGATSVVGLSHDFAGRLSTIVYPAVANDSVTFQYDYDLVGNLSDVSRLTPGNTTPYWTLSATYQGYRVKTEVLGNGVETNRSYNDLNGTVTAVTTQNPSAPQGNFVQQISYPLYDADGNLKIRNDTQPAEGFDYDAMGRLTTIATSGGASQTITYDELGNISSSNLGAYQYRGSSPHAVSQAGEDTFAYFLNGNLAVRSGPDIPGGTQLYSYTAFNLPKSVSSGQGTTEFEYDAFGQRVLKKNANNDVTRFVPDLYERRNTAADPNTIEHVFRVFAAGRAVAEIQRVEQGGAIASEKTLYIHDDALGSVNAITDSSGNRLALQHFDAFGKDLSPTPTTGVTMGFTGQQEDDDLGLINMRGRLYDPIIRRFTTPDPVVQEPAWSQSWNRYSYGWNNPLKWVDPSGFEDGPIENPELPGDDAFESAVESELDNEAQQDSTNFKTFYGPDGVPIAPQQVAPILIVGTPDSSGGQAPPPAVSIESSAGVEMSTGGFAPSVETTEESALALPPGLAQNLPGGSAATRAPLLERQAFFDSTMGVIGLGATAVAGPIVVATAPAVTVSLDVATLMSMDVGALGSAEDVAGAARGISGFGGVVSGFENSAGGLVVTAEGSVEGSDFAGFVNSGLMRGGAVNILSGVHGSAEGLMILAPEILAEDLAEFGGVEGVTVHNIAALSPSVISDMLSGSGTTIGAFCNSGACLAPFLVTP